MRRGSTGPAKRRMWGGGIIAALALLTTGLPSTAAPDAATCAPAVAARGVLRLVGGDLRLSDGPIVTLSGLRVAPDHLATIVDELAGRTVEVRGAGRLDRWGRLVAEAIVIADGAPIWLEAELVAQGRAMVAPTQAKDCGRALLHEEEAARAAGRGLWADPDNRPVAADDAAKLAARLGRFTLVEGRVATVNARGASIYLNLGRRWSESCTAVIATRDRLAFTRAGIDLDRLNGRAVRLRGHLEQHSGPAIALAVPEQLELIGAPRP